jgi:hypothetical protein
VKLPDSTTRTKIAISFKSNSSRLPISIFSALG